MAGKRYRFVLNIIDGLPSASHIGQAWADDDDIAANQTAGATVKWRPTTRYHDETAVILTAIQSGIENLISVQAENYKPNYLPQPLTARERIRARESSRRLARVHELFKPQ